jgi:glutamate formiminotransferase
MEYELIQSLGNCLDNVYNNYSEQHDRRTVASIKDNLLCVEYQTILRAAKDVEFQRQIDLLKSESTQMINSRLKLIKEEFKLRAERSLRTKKCNESDRMETLTVSPYSPIRTIKYTYVVCYEVS